MASFLKKVLNPVRYFAKDFYSFTELLLDRMRKEFPDQYNDFANTSQGMMLLDIMSYGLSRLSWGGDRVASDAFLSTARTYKGVTATARQLGYKISPATASTTDLSVTNFDPALTHLGSFPSGFQFVADNGMTFESIGEVFLGIGDTSATVPVREGETKRLVFTSNGSKSQRFKIANVKIDDKEYVAQESVRVWVDGSEWTEIEFIEFEETDQFEVDYMADPPVVIFGDGVAGNIPTNTAEIVIEFVVIHGEAGMMGSGQITTAKAPLIINGQEIKFDVTNPNVAGGGTDPEELEHIKRFAPMYFGARGGAVTKSDYEVIAGTFFNSEYGSVAKATAVTIREAFNDPRTELYSNDLKAVISSFLSDTDSHIVNINANDVTLNDDRLLLKATDGDFEDISDSLTQVLAALRTAYVSGIDSTSLGASFSQSVTDRSSDIKTELNNIEQKMADWVLDSTLTQVKADEVLAMTEPALSYADKIDGFASTLNTNLTNASSSFGQVNSEINTLEIEKDNVDDLRSSISAISTSIYNAVGDATTGMQENVNLLTAARNLLYGNFVGVLDVWESYVSDLFSDDCRANVVAVPILMRDHEGFFVAPSSGLVRSLQDALDEVKDVTHQVVVQDGSSMLVPVTFSIVLRTNSAYVVSEVQANIRDVLYDILRDRDFGESLYHSEIYERVMEDVLGITSLDVTLLSTYSGGGNNNVVIKESEIITRSTDSNWCIFT